MCVNVCVEGAILEGRALCNFLFLFYYTVLYTQDESTWATASSRLQMAEMAPVHEDGRDVRVLDEIEFGVFRDVLLAVDHGFGAFRFLVVENEEVEYRYSLRRALLVVQFCVERVDGFVDDVVRVFVV